MFSRADRFLLLARVLARTCGKNALKNSLPLYLTVGIGAFFLFAGNGLDAKTVATLGREHAPFRVSLFLIWTLAALPAPRALLATRSTFFLRALPIRRTDILALLCVGPCIVHLPWWALWARGAGPSTALGATLTVLAIQVYIIAGLRSFMDVIGLALSLLALALGPSLATALLAACSFGPGLRQAWIRAPEPRLVGRHSILTYSGSLALASAFAVSVFRGHRPVLLRAILFALAACVFSVLGLRNNNVSDPAIISSISLMVWGPACVFGAVGIAGPVLRTEAKAQWILDVCGTSRFLRVGSAAAALGAWAAACGGTYGLVIGETLGLGSTSVLFLALQTVAVLLAAAGGLTAVSARADPIREANWLREDVKC